MKPHGNKQIQKEGQVDRAVIRFLRGAKVIQFVSDGTRIQILTQKPVFFPPAKPSYLKQEKNVSENDTFSLCVLVFDSNFFQAQFIDRVPGIVLNRQLQIT